MTQGMFFSNGKMYLSWEVFLYIIIYILNFIGFHTRTVVPVLTSSLLLVNMIVYIYFLSLILI